jgi:hypothetical protein
MVTPLRATDLGCRYHNPLATIFLGGRARTSGWFEFHNQVWTTGATNSDGYLLYIPVTQRFVLAPHAWVSEFPSLQTMVRR